MSAHTFVRRAGKGASLPLRAGNYRVHTSRSRWWRTRAADTGVFTSPLSGRTIAYGVCRALDAWSPSPRLRGEGWGEGLFRRIRLAESPPHPTSLRFGRPLSQSRMFPTLAKLMIGRIRVNPN